MTESRSVTLGLTKSSKVIFLVILKSIFKWRSSYLARFRLSSSTSTWSLCFRYQQKEDVIVDMIWRKVREKYQKWAGINILAIPPPPWGGGKFLSKLKDREEFRQGGGNNFSGWPEYISLKFGKLKLWLGHKAQGQRVGLNVKASNF